MTETPSLPTGWITRDLRVAFGIAVVFGAIVLVLGFFAGIGPVVPTERVSIALGVNAAFPVALGLFSYGAAQFVRLVTREGTHDDLAQHVFHDIVLLMIFVAICYFHFNLKMWVPLINSTLWDDPYMATDEFMRPVVDGFAWVSLGLRSLFGDGFRWYQIAFVMMFALSFAYFAVERHRLYGPYAVAIMLVLSIGGLAYLIAPALGPFLYEDGTSVLATEAQAGMYVAYEQVQLSGAEWIRAYGSAYFTGALAAMPSLHMAHGAVMTWYIIRARSVLAPVFIFLLAWVVIDSVALRWHYLIDLPFGLLIAWAAIALSDRLNREPAPATA